MQGFAGMIGRSGRTGQGSKPGTAGKPGRGNILMSLAVGETAGEACDGMWDVVRWSLMVKACHLSDVDRFDLVNGRLAVLAALVPALFALRIVLLVPVLMYLSDASRMHTEFVATGHVYAGIELWWFPIFWLSITILLVAIAVATFKWTRRWVVGHDAG